MHVATQDMLDAMAILRQHVRHHNFDDTNGYTTNPKYTNTSNYFLTNCSAPQAESYYYAYSFGHKVPIYISKYAYDTAQRIYNGAFGFFVHDQIPSEDANKYRSLAHKQFREFERRYNFNVIKGTFDRALYEQENAHTLRTFFIEGAQSLFVPRGGIYE